MTDASDGISGTPERATPVVPAALSSVVGVLGRRRVAALGAVLAAVLLGRAAIGDAGFPTSLRIPLGDRVEQVTDWFTENCAWLYEPVATALDEAFNEILYWLTVVPAPVLSLSLIVLVWCAAGVRLGALTGIALALTVSFGLWEAMKETLALMSVAVAVTCAIGVSIGICASFNRRLEAGVRLVLDAMQTYPLFAYLVPAIVIFGAGNVAALVVTIIWALPPVTRMTLVGIRGVPRDTVEAAVAFGATRAQILRGVLLPLARPSILAGVNQTIMFAMAMAIVASMIGAAGLGEPVWTRLRVLQFGQALEAGIVLVLMAIIMDRALGASPEPVERASVPAPKAGGRPARWRLPERLTTRRRRLLLGGGAVLAFVIVVENVPSLRLADFTEPPERFQLSLRGGVESLVDWMNIHLAFLLDGTREAVQKYALNPVTDALAWMPWPALLVAVFVVGLAAVGTRGAALAVGAAAGIGALGMWEPATYTLGLVGVAVVSSLLIGLPLGIACAQSDWLAAVVRPVLDVMQTLPIFLFVIPSVVILGPGPVAGLLATVAFAIAPIIRLTNVALRGADPEMIEAATSFGATRSQVLRQVRLPLGVPTMLVGLNQTVMLALAMAVVSAFIGTPGLGGEILLSVADADLALGVQAGVAMFLLAVTTDRLFAGMVRRIAAARHLALA